jgi:hypothetical protein
MRLSVRICMSVRNCITIIFIIISQLLLVLHTDDPGHTRLARPCSRHDPSAWSHSIIDGTLRLDSFVLLIALGGGSPP